MRNQEDVKRILSNETIFLNKRRLVVEFDNDTIIYGNLDGIIISTDEKTIEITGYEKEELIGMNVTTLFSEDEMKRLPFEFNKLDQDLIVRNERTITRKDGSKLAIEMITRKLPDNTFQSVIHDISDLKRVEEQLRQNQEQMQALHDLIQCEFESEKDFIVFALEESTKLTNSKIGYFHYVKSDQKSVELLCWSKQLNEASNSIQNTNLAIENNPFLFDCITRKIPIIQNQYTNQISQLGFPEYISNLNRFALLPIIFRNKVVAIVAVANKDHNYSDTDIYLLRVYLSEVWKIILRMQNDCALKETEFLLRQQNEEFISMNEQLNARNNHIMEINKELKIAKDKAEESDHLKSAFLANMSHEIRTPMNAISGFTELLKNPNLDRDSINQYIDIIYANSQQLLSIIDDILDIARIETGQVKINQNIVNVNHVLDGVCHALQQQIKSKGISFKIVHGLSEEMAIVETDEIRLKQILTNLLNNALKFTESGSIIIGYSFNKDYLEFFVKDTGIGIAKENHNIVFERFRQVDTGIARKYGGTGLGLTISRVLVELLGGTIWLESELFIGSTFYFTIPYKDSTLLSISTESYNEQKEVFNWHDKTILLAEDEEFNYFYIHEILNTTRAKLIWAKNGEEAVRYCQSNPEIDFVLMDIKMPQLDGYEATKLIKSFRPQLPIVAQTAYAMSEDRIKALNAGCDNYIAKPINKKRLLNLIAQNFK